MKVTEALSIYAAILSSVVFVWNLHRAIPRYKVDVVFGTDRVDGEYVSGAYISVKNPSPHTVHLASISIVYPYRKTSILEFIQHTLKYRRFPLTVGWVNSSLSNYDIEDKCPLALESGQSVGILVPEKVLEKVFKDSNERIFKASVQDQLWRNKSSRKFEYPDRSKDKT